MTFSMGTPLSPSATRVLMCGAGGLGKEVIIEFQRLGVETIAEVALSQPDTQVRLFGKPEVAGERRML